MATALLDGNVTDQNGIAVPGALVYVYDGRGESGGLSDLSDSLGQAVSNPVTADENGYWSAYASTDQFYTLVYYWAGRKRYVEANVLLGTAGINTDVNLRANLASTASGDGAALVGFKQAGAGAVERTALDKAREVVSVKDFGAVGDGVTDDAGAFNAALATGLNVFVPAGTYALGSTLVVGGRVIDGTLQDHSGQALYGDGNYNTELRWIGTDVAVNMIEMRSARSLGYTNNAVSGLQIRNFLITGGPTAKCANVIWQENGTFHCFVEKIRSEAATGLGFEGGIGESFIRVQGTSASYTVHPTYRDVVITAIQQGNVGTGDPQPCGFWVEGAIEATFDNCASYGFEDCWRLGTGTSANARNVQNCRFAHCLGEIGNRSGLTDTAASLHIYFALNCTFTACKFDAGEGWGAATNQVPVKLSGLASFPINQVTFVACAIWGFTYANYAVVADSTAAYVYGVSFERCDFNGFGPGLVFADSGVDPVIQIPTDRNYFTNIYPTAYRMLARQATWDPSSIADGAGLTATLMESVFTPSDFPLLASIDQSQQGMFFTTYRTSTAGRIVGRLQNETGGPIDIVSSKVRVRPIQRDEIKAMAAKTWDPPAVAAGAITTTTLTVPGAKVGDFVRVAFRNSQTNNLNGLTLLGHVSADNTVTVVLYNGTGASSNLGAGTLRAVILFPVFDFTGSATYDPASLADGDGAQTTITVAGVNLGDFVVVSFSNDLQGVMMQGCVSAADTVLVRFQNETGGTIDLASGTILVGVIKRPSVI